MKQLIITLLAFLSATLYAAEGMERTDAVQPDEANYYKRFKHLNESPVFLDTIAIEAMLKQWEAEEPESIELQSAKFQYLVNKASLEIELSEDSLAESTAMLPKIPGFYENLEITNHLVLQDEGYAMENYQKAFEILDQAIVKHSDRLDLLSWKIDGYMRKYEFHRGVLAVFEMMQVGRQNGHKWKTLYNEPADQYDEELFESSGVNFLIMHKEISLAEILVDTLLATNPESINFRRAKADLLDIKMQKDSALNIYQELYSEAPDDDMVLIGITSCLRDLDRLDEARLYAEKLASNKNERAATVGRKILAQLDPIEWQYNKMVQWMQAHADDYDSLIERFETADETLTMQDIAHIYYGQAFLKEYSYFALNDMPKAFFNEDYKKCLKLCNKELKKMPASLSALFYGSICAKKLGDYETLRNYGFRTQQLVQMLHNVGDASDLNHAIPVLWVIDEYTIVREGYDVGDMESQALLNSENGPVDMLTFSCEAEPSSANENGQVKAEPEKKKIDFYFNVNYPLSKLNNTK